MSPATLVYVSSAPQGLPDFFPQDLGAVRPDIEDLELDYDSGTRSFESLLHWLKAIHRKEKWSEACTNLGSPARADMKPSSLGSVER